MAKPGLGGWQTLTLGRDNRVEPGKAEGKLPYVSIWMWDGKEQAGAGFHLQGSLAELRQFGADIVTAADQMLAEEFERRVAAETEAASGI